MQKIFVPQFTPAVDDPEETCHKLKQMIAITDMTSNPSRLLFKFLNTNNLADLTLNLDLDVLKDFSKFKEEFLLRYGPSDSTASFLSMQQLEAEDEIDLMRRIKRRLLNLRSNGDDSTLTKSELSLLRERFILSLKDETIQTQLRGCPELSLDKLIEKARALRKAKAYQESKLNIAFVQTNKQNHCSACGYAHSRENCRASQKLKTAYNKRPNKKYSHKIPMNPNFQPKSRYNGQPNFKRFNNRSHFQSRNRSTMSKRWRGNNNSYNSNRNRFNSYNRNYYNKQNGRSGFKGNSKNLVNSVTQIKNHLNVEKAISEFPDL